MSPESTATMHVRGAETGMLQLHAQCTMHDRSSVQQLYVVIHIWDVEFHCILMVSEMCLS